MTGSPSVILFDAKEHSHVTPYLAAIHASCITHDRTIATFLPPLSHDKLLSWWKSRIAEIADGSRVMFLLIDDTNSSGRIKGPEIMGVVMLYMPPSETGPFRCMVEKLLIRKNFRGRGGAKLLMSALEAEALNRQRTMLVRFSALHRRFRLVDTLFTAFGHGNWKPGRGSLQKTGIHRIREDPQLWHQPHGRAKGRHVLLQRYISAGVQRIIRRIDRPRENPNGTFIA